MRLRAKKVARRRYKVRATVVLEAGQEKARCAGGTAQFSAKPPHTSRQTFALRTTFDARCRSHITVVANRGTRLRVRFGGTDLLLPKRSRPIRLR